MTQTLAFKVAAAAIRHALAEKYPTRSVEYLLAWTLIVWSARVAWPGDVLAGPTFRYLLALAPEPVWAAFGLVVGFVRVFALIRNGGWRRSPIFRFIGAMLGLNFWLILTVLYAAAIDSGAADFPMRAVLPVFMFFEAYSCFRCGQDHAAAREKAKLIGQPDKSGGLGNG